MTTTATPEIVTTDVETFTAGRAEAVLQRHDFADGEVRFDVDLRGVPREPIDDPAALFDAASVFMRAGNALREVQRRQGH